MQEENRHSLLRKQGAGVRRKETGSEENQGPLLLFSKNCVEVWLIFSVTLSSAAQQCDSLIHIKNIHSFSYSLSCGLSLDIEYSSLYSTVGLCFISFHCFPNSQSSLPLYPSSWQLHVLALFGCRWTLIYPLLMRKSFDTFQKREMKPRTVLGLHICGSWT